MVRLITTIMIDAISNFSSITNTPSFDTAARDRHHLAFHIESDDYFPYLSALLGFVEETLSSADMSDELVRIQVEAIRSTREDLGYLQDRFHIQPRA